MKKAAKITLTALSAAAACGAAVYGVTHVLMDVAMNRQPPRLRKKKGGASRLTGETPNDGFRTAQKEASRQLAAAPHEVVAIESRDGLRLAGHWFPCPDAKRIIIAFHGWHSAWHRDFALISDFWRQERCSVLYVEQRAQQNSEGDYIGFGLTEREDCLAWAQWVTERFGTALPIYLAGVSMGGTTVLMAADLPLPEAVRGIIADSAYTSPHAIWRHVARKNLHIPFLLGGWMADLVCRARLSVGSDECSTLDSLAAAKIPVLLIHGQDDHFVPVRMAYENQAACGSLCRLLVVPQADHAMSYYMARQEYGDALRRFWASCEE